MWECSHFQQSKSTSNSTVWENLLGRLRWKIRGKYLELYLPCRLPSKDWIPLVSAVGFILSQVSPNSSSSSLCCPSLDGYDCDCSTAYDKVKRPAMNSLVPSSLITPTLLPSVILVRYAFNDVFYRKKRVITCNFDHFNFYNANK